MADNSKIEWTDHTLNPWIGCTKVGPGCEFCYAEELMDTRYGRVEWGGDRSRTSPSTWNAALKWERNAAAFLAAHGRRQRVFCSSLADVFDNHKSIMREWRIDLASLVLATPSLDWLFLTKRIGNALEYLMLMFPDGVPANVRVGATIVNQQEWDRDRRKIAQVRVATGTRPFLSMEPLLGRVNLETDPTWKRFVGWVIVGGESGAKARMMDPWAASSIRDQCERGQVPFLFKQWGAWAPVTGDDNTTREGDVIAMDTQEFLRRGIQMRKMAKASAGRILDGRTYTEFPA
jgi:protein gp37